MLQKWRNNKTGIVYIKTGEVINATNGENDGQRMIVYHKYLSLSDSTPVYVREMNEFYKKFTCIGKEYEPTWEV